MPERICKTPHEYAGRQVEAGQKFHVEQADVALMVATGRVEREEGDAVPGYVSRDMSAGWPGNYKTAAITAAPRRKGGNQRRAA